MKPTYTLEKIEGIIPTSDIGSLSRLSMTVYKEMAVYNVEDFERICSLVTERLAYIASGNKKSSLVPMPQ